MIQKIILSNVLLIAFCSNISGQALLPGDRLPDFILSNVLNRPDQKLSFKEYTGRLLILDFWATNCVACLKKIPLINSLQNEFSNKIQFILINTQSKDTTLSFFEKRKNIKPDFSIPLVTQDTVLGKYFPHYGVPMHVWIDSDGIIQYITDGTISREIISIYLSGKQPDIPNYKMENEYRKSLIDKRFEKKVKYYSYISSYIEGIQTGSGFENDEIAISANCKSVTDLFILAYNENEKYNFQSPGRLEMNVCDSLRYFKPAEEALLNKWKNNFSYNYDLFLPPGRMMGKYKIMQEDLKRFFCLDATIEQRSIKCLVLVRTSNQNKLNTKGGSSERKFYTSRLMTAANLPVRYLRNQPYQLFSSIMKSLVENAFKIPFVDETGITENIDIDIKGQVIDSPRLEGILEELKKYDLMLVEKNCMIDVLVLKEMDNCY